MDEETYISTFEDITDMVYAEYLSMRFPASLSSTKVTATEVWKAKDTFLTESGVVIGYVYLFSPFAARAHLGYAMGCVKEEDTVLLPLERQDE